MSEEEGLGELVPHEGLEGPCAVRGCDEPHAGAYGSEPRREASAVDLPAEVAVQAEEAAPVLVYADGGSARGAVRDAVCGSGGRGLLRCEPLEEAVRVGDEGAGARVDEPLARVLLLRRVADPARHIARVDAHGPRRALRPRGPCCRGCYGRLLLLLVLLEMLELLPDSGLYGRRNRLVGQSRLSALSPGNLLRCHSLCGEQIEAKARHLDREVGQLTELDALALLLKLLLPLQPIRQPQLLMVHLDPPGAGTSSLKGVALAIAAGVLVATGLNVQRRVPPQLGYQKLRDCADTLRSSAGLRTFAGTGSSMQSRPLRMLRRPNLGLEFQPPAASTTTASPMSRLRSSGKTATAHEADRRPGRRGTPRTM